MASGIDVEMQPWLDIFSGDLRYSLNRFEGDGINTTWELQFAGGYIDQSHVKAYKVDPSSALKTDLTIAWVGPFTISITPAIENGWRLVVYRDTPKATPLVNFVDGAIFNERNIDKVATQAVFSAAEMVDTAGEAVDAAVTAAQYAAEVAALGEDSALSAAASAAAALVSQNAASASAGAASTSASNASDSAGAASTSASSASASSISASSSAGTATTQAGIATTQAGIATTQAGNAEASASTATTQAGIATTQAGIATTQASAASASATAAMNSYDSFDDRYLGAKAVAPTLDNDGAALLEGALYWNTTSKVMSAYNGSSWVTAYAPTSGLVDTTTDQTIAGSKTFSSPPVVPADSFSFAQLQNIPTGTILGRSSAGTGDVEALQASLLLPAASETVSGGVELADATEAAAGTDGTRALSPLRLRDALAATGGAPIYACRAWVNFNGTGTVAIRASGNVSSITDNGVGDYTVNFTTAMPDANYSALISGMFGSNGVNITAPALQNSLTTTSCQILVPATGGGDGGPTDSPLVTVAIFR